jgi:hypothetical protein
MSNTETVVAYRAVTRGSDRSFGIVFACVFALIGLWPMLHGSAPRLWALAVAAACLAAGLLRPQFLSPLNRLWFRFGLLLHHVVNPVLMLLIYYGAVVPTGLVLRALGKDVLRLKLDRTAASYWIIREPPGPAMGSMEKQF